tara:strand:- start:66 stop:377 length:312 start_codon:yes stop_codon:yes gene_type:complete
MIDKLKSLKDKNKILYYILLPLLGIGLLVAAVAKIMGDFNIQKAKDSIKKTQKKDFDLEKEQKEAEAKAKALQDEADDHNEKADQHKEEANNADSDLDWHKKE